MRQFGNLKIEGKKRYHGMLLAEPISAKQIKYCRREDALKSVYLVEVTLSSDSLPFN
jgi:hypothetical protein